MSNERYIEQKLCCTVKTLGGKAFKWIAPGHTGVPDRIVILPKGRILFVELKRSGRKDGTSARQKKVIDWLVKMGCAVFVISEVDDIQRMLGEVYGVQAL